MRDRARKSWEGLHFDGEDGGEVVNDGVPRVASVIGAVDLAARSAEVDAAGVEFVHGHGVAKDVDVAIFLRESLGQGFPFVATGAAAIYAELAFVDKAFAIAFDGDDIDGFRFVGVDVDHETEVGG